MSRSGATAFQTCRNFYFSDLNNILFSSDVWHRTDLARFNIKRENHLCLQNGSADVPTSKASVESMTKSEVISEGAVRKRVSGTSKKLKDALVHQVIQETEFPTGKVGPISKREQFQNKTTNCNTINNTCGSSTASTTDTTLNTSDDNKNTDNDGNLVLPAGESKA